MTEEQIRKTYLDFQKNNPIRHCSLEAQLLEFGKLCATEATKEVKEEFESCLEAMIKGENPFPNLCWKLICEANDKLKKQNGEAKEIIKEQINMIDNLLIMFEDLVTKDTILELRDKAEAFLNSNKD